jgi:hypothetical protein
MESNNNNPGFITVYNKPQENEIYRIYWASAIYGVEYNKLYYTEHISQFREKNNSYGIKYIRPYTLPFIEENYGEMHLGIYNIGYKRFINYELVDLEYNSPLNYFNIDLEHLVESSEHINEKGELISIDIKPAKK